MPAKSVTRSQNVTALPRVTTSTSNRGSGSSRAATSKTTSNYLQNKAQTVLGSSSSTGGPGAGSNITQRRVGDYIIYYRNGVEIDRKYVGGGAVNPPSSAYSTTSNRSKESVATPKVNQMTGGGAATGGMSGTSGGAATGGSMGGSLGGTASGGGAASSTPDVGQLYGYTSGLSPNEVMAGIQYPNRVLNDVLNAQASPTTTGLMNPWMDLAANPWALYLMNQGNAGTGFENAPTQSDTYNFMANLLANAMTPGASVPSFGQVLQNLATALGNANSPVYGGVFGDTLNAAGLDSPGSVLRNVAEALSGFGMTLNPLAAQNLQSSMGLMQNDYLNNYNVNNPQGMENPATYLLRRLGIQANIPNTGPNPTGM